MQHSLVEKSIVTCFTYLKAGSDAKKWNAFPLKCQSPCNLSLQFSQTMTKIQCCLHPNTEEHVKLLALLPQSKQLTIKRWLWWNKVTHLPSSPILPALLASSFCNVSLMERRKDTTTWTVARVLRWASSNLRFTTLLILTTTLPQVTS